MVVVGEFCMGGFVSPGTKVRSAKHPKVHFNLLIDMFCLTVGLEMIGSGEGEVIVQEFAKFFGKSRGELWTTVQDDLVI